MTRIAYFDCPSGISGDMTLGALLDAGADPGLLDRTVAALDLAGEVTIAHRHGERGHLGGIQVDVRCAEHGPARSVPDLLRVVGQAALPDRVKERARQAITRVGEAESRVHGRPPAELHLHELGGADALVDLAGSFWLLESLHVDAVYATPLPAPGGPHSAPATLRILAGSRAVLTPDPRPFELVTPTGAVILVVLATFERPRMRLDRVGYGLGSRPQPGNAVGLWLGEPVREASAVDVVTTNLDDLPPNQLSALCEDLLAAGALDVTTAPILMKKGRLGHQLTVLSAPDSTAALVDRVLRGSSSLGVRVQRADRVVAGRQLLTVPVAGGTVRVKVKLLDGRPVDVAPEYEDCRALGGDVRETMRRAATAARTELGL
ncbi:MAG: LarC family nickel insertion protein [Candidatus Dormibacteraceae bacterium]